MFKNDGGEFNRRETEKAQRTQRPKLSYYREIFLNKISLWAIDLPEHIKLQAFGARIIDQTVLQTNPRRTGSVRSDLFAAMHNLSRERGRS